MRDWRDELGRLKARQVEMANKASAADRLLKAYRKAGKAAAEAHEEAYQLWLAGEPAPRPEQGVLFEDDPIVAAVEKALAELLGEGYRTPAAIAADAARVELDPEPPAAPAPAVEPPPAKKPAKPRAPKKKPAAAAEPPAAPAPPPSDQAEDWSGLWRSRWTHAFKVPTDAGDVELGVRYEAENRYGPASGELYFGDPLESAGYRRYGLAHIDAAGAPLGVPAAYRSRPFAFVERLGRHLMRLTQAKGREVLDDPDAPAWRAAPLSAIGGLSTVAERALSQGGVRTVGDLVDAVELGADDCRLEPDTLAPTIPDPVWKKVVEAVGRYLDFPGRRPFEPFTAGEAEDAAKGEAAMAPKPAKAKKPRKPAEAPAKGGEYPYPWDQAARFSVAIDIGGAGASSHVVEVDYEPEGPGEEASAMLTGPRIVRAWGGVGVAAFPDERIRGLTSLREYAFRAARFLAVRRGLHCPDVEGRKAAWRLKPVTANVLLSPGALEALAAARVRTWGDLADGIDLGLSVFDVETRRDPLASHWPAVVEAHRDAVAAELKAGDRSRASTVTPRPEAIPEHAGPAFGTVGPDGELRFSEQDAEEFEAECQRIYAERQEAAGEATWRDRSIAHVRRLTGAQTSALKAAGIRTIGELADAVGSGYTQRPAGISVKDWTAAEVALMEHFRTLADGPAPEPPTAPALIGSYKVGPVWYKVGGGPFPDYRPPAPDDAWKLVKIDRVVKSKAARSACYQRNILTLGDLAEETKLAGGLAAALDQDRNTAAVFDAVRDWAASHPGFPVEVLEDAARVGEWAGTPLNMVVIRGDLVEKLRRSDLHTLGDLSDSCDLCGSLAMALDDGDWTPDDVAQVERDVRTWTSRRPGYPVDNLRLPDDAQAEPGGDALEALHEALYHEGADPGWAKLIPTGASDDQVLGKLAGIWPASPEYRCDEPGSLGYTVRGGDRPAYWHGHAKPSGASTPMVPTLQGRPLCDAVRRVLRIPELVADVEVSTAPPERPKKPRVVKSKRLAEARP